MTSRLSQWVNDKIKLTEQGLTHKCPTDAFENFRQLPFRPRWDLPMLSRIQTGYMALQRIAQPATPTRELQHTPGTEAEDQETDLDQEIYLEEEVAWIIWALKSN